MTLFGETDVLDVVTADDIKKLTGIGANDFKFVNEENQEQALTSLLEKWIERIASHIYVRIDRTVSVEDGEFLAVQDVLIRTVANLVAVSQQQHSSPVIQIDNFAINILNTSEVTENLDAELAPFIRYKKGGSSGWVSVFSSLDEYEGE